MSPVRLAVLGAAAYLVLLVALTALGFEPEPLPLAGFVAAGAALAGLVWQGSGDPGSGWDGVAADPPAAPRGADPHLAAHVRVIDEHLSARTVDARLRDRLAAIADARLLRHHGLRLDEPGAAELLGEDLHRRLTGPPRRLSTRVIEDDIRRIEAL